MANSSNTMLITTPGLKKVSKELLNKRNFVSSLIEQVGNPLVTSDGVASGFSESNYFKKSDLSFTDEDTLKIVVYGTYIPMSDGTASCMWALAGTGTNTLNLEIYSNKIQLWEGNVVIASLKDISISNEDSIKIEIDLTSTTCTFSVVIANEKVYNSSSTFTAAKSLSIYNSILLGVRNTSGDNHWLGSINLPEFIIYKNGESYYTPSIDNIFKFSKLLICDSSITLTDSSEEVVNHCYEIPVYELRRTNNNILISAQIPSDIYLNINKIGLYSTGDDGTVLFSLLDELVIKKTKGLEYNLILNINLDLNVVNTIAMPEFVISELGTINYEDFDDVRKLFAYLSTNLERIIKQNATEVGYNKPQVNYRLEDEIELIEDNYLAVRNFLRVLNNFQVTTEPEFDSSKVTVHGNPVISNNLASGFSISSYLTPIDFSMGGSSSWDLSIPFITSSDINVNQTIISSGSDCSFEPLVLSIENGYCKVTLSKPEKLILNSTSTPVSSFTYKRAPNKTTINNVSYYFWTAEDSTYTIQNIYTLDKEPTSSSTLYQMINGTLTEITTLVFSSLDMGNIINKNLFRVDTKAKYYLNISYNTNSYQFYLSQDNINFKLIDSENTSDPIAIFNKLYIGVAYTEASLAAPFTGYINLAYFNLTKWASKATGFVLRDSSSSAYFYYKGSEIGSLIQNIVLYPWNYTSGSNTYSIYTKTTVITENTQLYNDDLSEYTGTDFVIVLPPGQTEYVIQYNGNNTTLGGNITYYPWIALESSYPVQTIYTKSDTTEVLFKMSNGALVLITDLSFDYLINEPVAIETNMSKEVITNNSILEDYFHIPTYNYSSCRINNLCDDNSKLDVLDCSITGNKVDHIDFSGANGFSLSVKVSLKELFNSLEKATEASTELILAKISDAIIFKDAYNINYTYIKDSSKTTIGGASYYTWSALETSYSVDKIYTVEPNPTISSYFYKLVDGSLVLVSEFTYVGVGSTQYLNISLSCNDDKSVFTLSASIGANNLTISKEIDILEISSYSDNILLLTLSFNASSTNRLLNLYKNNTLLASKLIPSETILSAPKDTDMITNYLTIEEMSDASSCISDIIFINGPMSVNQLYYVTNLLDCNF